MHRVGTTTKFVASFAVLVWGCAYVLIPMGLRPEESPQAAELASIAVYGETITIPAYGEVITIPAMGSSKFPANRNVYISLKAPPYMTQNTSSELSLSMYVDSPNGREVFLGRQKATLVDSQFVSVEAWQTCAEVNNPNTACIDDEGSLTEVEFNWTLEAREAANAILRIRLPNEALRFHSEPEANFEISQGTDIEDSLLRSRRRSSAIVFSAGDERATIDANGTVSKQQLGNFELDIARYMISVPMEIRTPLHLSYFQDYLFRLLGAVLVAVLSFSLLPDIVQRIRAPKNVDDQPTSKPDLEKSKIGSSKQD